MKYWKLERNRKIDKRQISYIRIDGILENLIKSICRVLSVKPSDGQDTKVCKFNMELNCEEMDFE